MATYHVTVAGAGDNSGDSWANAMANSDFATAYGSLTVGDICLVKSGTYSFSDSLAPSNSGTYASPILIFGVVSSATTENVPTPAEFAFGTDRPIFNFDTGYRITVGVRWGIYNFRLNCEYNGTAINLGNQAGMHNCDATNSYNNSGCKVLDWTTGCRISYCNISSTYGHGINRSSASDNLSIVYCRFNTPNGVALMLGGQSACYRNIIDTSSTGIQLSNLYGGSVFIAENTIYNCSIGIRNAYNAHTSVIINNIISDCGVGFQDNSTTYQKSFYFDYNNWYNNTIDHSWDDGSTEDNTYKGPNDVDVDPDFVNAGSGDFTPQTTGLSGGMPIIVGV